MNVLCHYFIEKKITKLLNMINVFNHRSGKLLIVFGGILRTFLVFVTYKNPFIFNF